MKIFVLHYSKLTERKANIIQQFELHNITDYEFIEQFDKDELMEPEIANFTEKCSSTVISLFLKHIHVYKQIVEQQYENALIFEDDVILHPQFTHWLYIYMSHLPKTYDLLYIGDGCRLHIPPALQTPGKYIYAKGLKPTLWGGLGSSRCTDSYLASNSCAKKMLKYWETTPVSASIDFWLNEVAIAKNLNVYWAEPTIVTQGSQCNMFARSISETPDR